jgi:hypothetical protein
MLFLGVAACDRDASDEEIARALPCDLQDEECAALPIAAGAFEVLESMDVDPDEVEVMLLEWPDDVDPADEPSNGFALTSEAPPPVFQNSSCNSVGGPRCCCYWGDVDDRWGCWCT